MSFSKVYLYNNIKRNGMRENVTMHGSIGKWVGHLSTCLMVYKDRRFGATRD